MNLKRWRGSDKHPEILKLLVGLLNAASVFFFSLEETTFLMPCECGNFCLQKLLFLN